MGKSKRQLADEAWLRMNTPDNNGALPGQLTIEGAIADAERPAVTPPEPVTGELGNVCSKCGKTLTILHGWAYSREGPPWTMQCPNCGVRFEVTEEQHHFYRALVRATYAALKPVEKTKKTKKSRGSE